MAGPAFALLPSPFVGPATWAGVASHLRDGGHEVVEVAHPAVPPAGPDDVRRHLLARLPGDRDLVVVPHSNAGAYVPLLVAARPRVVAAVFVDAILPPSHGRQRLARPGARDRLAAVADDGRLPRWTDWFAPAEVAALFPDAATRQAVEAEQHRLPLDYLDATVDVPSGWDAVPCGYLAFGDTYADERASAAARGWPVVTLDGLHLHQLAAPEVVARTILSLATP